MTILQIGPQSTSCFHLFRSPGGTPLRKLQECQQPASDDPAAIIAQALRKKFSHKVFQDSPGVCGRITHYCCTLCILIYCFSPLVPDKENLDRSDMSLSAGFESPTVKLVRIVGAYNMEKWGCGVGTILLSLILLP